MNDTHLHLIITDLPIFGSILGALVIAYGIGVKSQQTIFAAYGLFLISAIGAGISYFTGEAAEETVEKLQDVSKDLVEIHEEFALVTLVSFIVLGVASMVGIFVTVRKPGVYRTAAGIILFLSMICFGLGAWTGYIGGKIRHTEIRDKSIPQGQDNENVDHE